VVSQSWSRRILLGLSRFHVLWQRRGGAKLQVISSLDLTCWSLHGRRRARGADRSHPSVDHPSVDHPSLDHPSVDHPSVDHPSVDHPSLEQRQGTPSTRW
jgi:hypothetical protein